VLFIIPSTHRELGTDMFSPSPFFFTACKSRSEYLVHNIAHLLVQYILLIYVHVFLYEGIFVPIKFDDLC
jgi:hypothetical protein